MFHNPITTTRGIRFALTLTPTSLPIRHNQSYSRYIPTTPTPPHSIPILTHPVRYFANPNTPPPYPLPHTHNTRQANPAMFIPKATSPASDSSNPQVSESVKAHYKSIKTGETPNLYTATDEEKAKRLAEILEKRNSMTMKEFQETMKNDPIIGYNQTKIAQPTLRQRIDAIRDYFNYHQSVYDEQLTKLEAIQKKRQENPTVDPDQDLIGQKRNAELPTGFLVFGVMIIFVSYTGTIFWDFHQDFKEQEIGVQKKQSQQMNNSI